MIQFLPRPFFRLLKPPWSVIELNGHCHLRWQIKTKHVLLIKLQVFRVLLAAWVKRLDQTFVRYAIEKSAAVGFWLDNAAAEGGVPLIWKMYARFDAIHALWRVFESFYKKTSINLVTYRFRILSLSLIWIDLGSVWQQCRLPKQKPITTAKKAAFLHFKKDRFFFSSI